MVPLPRSFGGLVVALALVAGCRRDTVADQEMASQAPERYRYLYQGFTSEADEERLLAALPYERIQLQEAGGWLMSYQDLTLWRDGRAELGGDPAQHGHVHAFDYGRLCELIEAIDFEALARHYAWGGFDGNHYTLRVWPSGATDPIEVEDYGGVGPVELWGLRAAIEGVARRIEWK